MSEKMNDGEQIQDNGKLNEWEEMAKKAPEFRAEKSASGEVEESEERIAFREDKVYTRAAVDLVGGIKANRIYFDVQKDAESRGTDMYIALFEQTEKYRGTSDEEVGWDLITEYGNLAFLNEYSKESDYNSGILRGLRKRIELYKESIEHRKRKGADVSLGDGVIASYEWLIDSFEGEKDKHDSIVSFLKMEENKTNQKVEFMEKSGREISPIDRFGGPARRLLAAIQCGLENSSTREKILKNASSVSTGYRSSRGRF